MEIERLHRPMVLILLLAGDVAFSVRLRSAAEAATVAVIGDDPPAVGDGNLAARRRDRHNPRFRRGVTRFSRLEHGIAVGISDRCDRVGTGQRGTLVAEPGFAVSVSRLNFGVVD